MTFKRRFNLQTCLFCLARCPSCPALSPAKRRRLDDAVQAFTEGLLGARTFPGLEPRKKGEEEDPP